MASQAGIRPVALVSGANRGIGFAIASALAKAGHRVALGARKLAEGEAAAARIVGAGGDAYALQLDVADAASRTACVKQLLEREGRIDVLVNNAGVALDKWVKVQALDLDVLRATLEVNLIGALHLTQLVLPAMKSVGRGRIVNISSELGSIAKSGMGGSAAYRISKTALNMLTKLTALELKDHPNILVNAAAPGWVATELGGMDAPRTPDEGAKTPVWLATLPDGGPTGGFFRDLEPYPW